MALTYKDLLMLRRRDEVIRYAVDHDLTLQQAVEALVNRGLSHTDWEA